MTTATVAPPDTLVAVQDLKKTFPGTQALGGVSLNVRPHEIIGIVGENGGFDYARQQGEEFAERAQEALAGLPDTVARRSLTASISYVMERHS